MSRFRQPKKVKRLTTTGRGVEFGDVIANGAGVSCGVLLGLPSRTLAAIP